MASIVTTLVLLAVGFLFLSYCIFVNTRLYRIVCYILHVRVNVPFLVWCTEMMWPVKAVPNNKLH